MNDIVVSDTNIFIDLFKLNLIDSFFQIGWKIHTNIFVLNELTDERQQTTLLNHSELIVEHYDDPLRLSSVRLLFDRRQRLGLSFTDCSVISQGITLSCPILTGDGKMRKTAKEMSVECHGILYVLDHIIEQLLTFEQGIQALEKLKRINPRIPLVEIENRLKKYSKRH